MFNVVRKAFLKSLSRSVSVAGDRGTGCLERLT